MCKVRFILHNVNLRFLIGQTSEEINDKSKDLVVTKHFFITAGRITAIVGHSLHASHVEIPCIESL